MKLTLLEFVFPKESFAQTKIVFEPSEKEIFVAEE